MIPGERGARELPAAVQTAVIVSTEQGFISQGQAEALNNPALDGDNRLQVDS